MNHFHTSIFLLLLIPATACTSADVAIRKPQEVQAFQTAGAKPAAPQRPPPILPERGSVLGVPPPPRSGPATAAPYRPGPVPVTSCDPGGCWVDGQRYHSGAGNTYLDKGGRMCQRNGAWMQCF